METSNNLADGQCGLSDGSSPGDWRLSNVRELHSLIDFANRRPALPSEHPFTVELRSWWVFSSTTQALTTNSKWGMGIYNGHLTLATRDTEWGDDVWPARDMQIINDFVTFDPDPSPN